MVKNYVKINKLDLIFYAYVLFVVAFFSGAIMVNIMT